MKTITYSIKRLIPILFFSLAISVTSNAQMDPQVGAVEDSMDELAPPCEEQDVDMTYRVYDHTGSENYKHSVWVNGFPCSNTKANFSFNDEYAGYAWTKTSNGNFVLEGTAVLSGIQGNCGGDWLESVWSVAFEFRPAEEGDGIVPKSENGFDDTGFPENPIWDYYVIVRGDMDKIMDSEDAEEALPDTNINFYDMASNNYGFQVGEGGNVKNAGPGASSWLDYTVTMGQESWESGNKHADINVNLMEFECPPIAEPDDACYAAEWLSYKPVNEDNIAEERQNPNRALGEPDRSNGPIVDPDEGFVSLGGNGGELVLQFEGAVFDMPGPDIQVWETTFSGDNCAGANDERARIEVSKNGNVWHEIGVICRDGDPLDLAGMPFSYITQIRITDVTDGPGNGGDGYDVDGVEALNGCQDVPGEDPDDACENFSAFYAHNGGGNASSVLYSVSFVAGPPAEAIFEEIFDFDGMDNSSYRVHISYDEQFNLIYAARNDGSELVTLSYNPGTMKWDVQNMVDLPDVPGGVVQNVFFGDYVWLGSSQTNDIYQVNPLTGAAQHWDISGLNVNGGDLTVNDGVIYSASRSGKKIYEIKLNNDNSFTGSATVVNDGQGTPGQVNGFANSLSGNFLMTNDGAEEIFVLDANTDDGFVGSEVASYAIDAPFEKLLDGDLASGCADGGGEEPNECDTPKAFYANHHGGDTDLYRVTLDEGNSSADLDFIVSLPYQAHITLNTDNGYVYAVDEDDTKIYKINPNGGTVLEDETIVLDPQGPAINSIYCMAYANGMIYLGSDQKNSIYEVDPNTGMYSVIASEVPVQGGDLIFRGGRLYLATRAGNKLYFIAGGPDSEIEVGNIASKVNGLGLNANDEFITTHFGESMIYRYDGAGNELTGYSTDGFEFKNGDLATGCTAADPEPLCDIAAIGNPGAELPATGNRFDQYGPGELPNAGGFWDTTTSIEIQKSGEVDGNLSFCGDYHFELLSRAEQDNMYQVIDTNVGAMVYVSFYHKKRRDNSIVNKMEVLAGDYSTFNMDGNNLTRLGDIEERTYDEEWVYVYRSFEATSDKMVVMLRGLEGSTVSIGNLIDDVYIGCDLPEERDPCYEQAPSLVPHTGSYSNELVTVNLYPVPSINDLNIEIENAEEEIRGSYYISSLNGRISHQGTISVLGNETKTISEDVSELAPGVYFLVMEINGNRTTKKFVKSPR